MENLINEQMLNFTKKINDNFTELYNRYSLIFSGYDRNENWIVRVWDNPTKPDINNLGQRECFIECFVTLNTSLRGFRGFRSSNWRTTAYTQDFLPNPYLLLGYTDSSSAFQVPYPTTIYNDINQETTIKFTTIPFETVTPRTDYYATFFIRDATNTIDSTGKYVLIRPYKADEEAIGSRITFMVYGQGIYNPIVKT